MKELRFNDSGDLIELTDDPDLKKLLISLRKKGIINESTFIRNLDKMTSSSLAGHFQFVPLVDMIGVIDNDSELLVLENSLKNNKNEMKRVARDWEEENLSRDETKEKLTLLVQQQKHLIHDYESLQSRIMIKISRLRKLKKYSDLSIDDLISFLIHNSDDDQIKDLVNKFSDILIKYTEKRKPGEQDIQRQIELDTVEVDIINSLMTPIIEKAPIVFNLEEVIKPVEDENFPSLLSESKKKKETSSNIIQPRPKQSYEKKIPPSLWNLVGNIAYNSSKNPLGIIRPPIVVDGKIYLPIVWEKSLQISLLKKQYSEIFEQTELNLELNTTQQIKTAIGETLKVPSEMALQPSIFNHWITEIGAKTIPAKPQLKKVKFVDEKAITNPNSDFQIIKDGDLEQIRIPAWIPAPGKGIAQSVQVNQDIQGMAGSNFGALYGIMRNTPFGEIFVIERKIPPSYILDLFLAGLGMQNLAGLRFSIAKTLKIGEGEVFLPENLWNINNHERLLISPHEILSSYFTVLPSDAFLVTNVIQAKIGVYFHSIPETFRYLIGKPLIKNENETGLIYGFSVDKGSFSILWSEKTSVDIIKGIGRKSSAQYVNRFQRRISMALGIPLDESLWPSNLARYFLNFIWIEENQSLKDELEKVEQQFSLKKVLFNDIGEITKDGLKCKTHPG